MNKLNAIVATIMGVCAGVHIASSVWNPSNEKNIIAILCIAAAAIWITKIKESQKQEENKTLPDENKEG